MSTTAKGKYPWMMFYPADHRADPAVRMCSIAARGLWVELICLMHEAEPYGHLLSKGARISTQKLAMVAGVAEIDIESLLAELENHGVFSRDDSGVIYCRRMVRDFRKRERNAENGKLGGNPRLIGRVKRSVKPRDKAQKPDTKGQTPKSTTFVASASEVRGFVSVAGLRAAPGALLTLAYPGAVTSFPVFKEFSALTAARNNV